MEIKMTFWTMILVASLGGLFSSIFTLAIIMFGYWLNNRIERKKR